MTAVARIDYRLPRVAGGGIGRGAVEREVSDDVAPRIDPDDRAHRAALQPAPDLPRVVRPRRVVRVAVRALDCLGQARGLFRFEKADLDRGVGGLRVHTINVFGHRRSRSELGPGTDGCRKQSPGRARRSLRGNGGILTGRPGPHPVTESPDVWEPWGS